MFRSILAARTKRVLLCFWRSIPKAFSASFVFSMFVLIMLMASGDEETTASKEIISMLTTFTFIWIGISFFEISRLKKTIFHQFDDDLIGNAFTGINHRSRCFEKGLNLFHRGDFRNALEVFTDLSKEEKDMSVKEKSVNEFYRGRCYHILEAFPNAIICYENAVENGFSIPELPIFIARCYAENGGIKKAEELFIGLMREDYKYYSRIRCELGNMYLKLNDGETALKWFNEAIERREQYANALGGAAIAHILLHNPEKSEALYTQALLNHIEDSVGFTRYYKEIQAAVMLESHNK